MAGVVILVDKTSPRCEECRQILPHHFAGYAAKDRPACSHWTPEGEIESRRILEVATADWPR